MENVTALNDHAAAARPTSAVKTFENRRQEIQRKERLTGLVTIGLLTILFLWSFGVSEFFDGNRGADPLARMGRFLQLMNPNLRGEVLFEDSSTSGSLASWFYAMPLWLPALWQTLAIAIFSSVIGALIAIPVSMLASRNLVKQQMVCMVVRRILEAIRTLPDIIVALILVAAFGIGPLAGVITLSLSTIGRLGKLYSEVNENADMKVLESIRGCGGGWWQQIRYGLVPQAAPGYASYALLKFEGNIGGAAALGIVGAGGIGIELSRAITYTQFSDYLAILLMITILIFITDMVSEAIRHRLIGIQGGAI